MKLPNITSVNDSNLPYGYIINTNDNSNSATNNNQVTNS